MSTETDHKSAVTQMAEEIFGISMIAWQMRQQGRETGGWDLSETEYLTLDLLNRHDSLTVGQIQRRIGVLPAQMSRIVRALETKFDAPLISCTINPDDKRKVDVAITELGRTAHKAFREGRLAQAVEVFRQIPDQDLREFMRVMRQIRRVLAESVKPA